MFFALVIGQCVGVDILDGQIQDNENHTKIIYIFDLHSQLIGWAFVGESTNINKFNKLYIAHMPAKIMQFI